MPVAGLISGGIGLIGSAISRGNSNAKLGQLLKDDPQYKENPLAAQRLGLAQTLFNARMPGAASIEKNIYGNQANTLAKAQRGATDSSDLLSFTGGIQGQTNQAFDKLGMEEAGDYQRRYGNVSNAQDGLMEEQNRVFQDKVRRFQDRAQIEGAQQQNNGATWQELSNFGIGMANLGVSAGWKWPQGGASSSTGLTTRMPTETMPNTWIR
jgi:hypothetical protein